MALGGGSFTTQNKVLPGAYINFVSAATASAALSDRGIATMPLELDWGPDGDVFTVTSQDFQKNSQAIFGYLPTHDKMKGLGDLFINAQTLHAYRLNGGGVKASNSYATARYAGIRGNDISIVIQPNVDVSTSFDVTTMLGTSKVDTQTVAAATDLVPNNYVDFIGTATLGATAGTPLTGGTNGAVDGTAHQAYLDLIESYSYNTMGVVVTDDTTKRLYASFVERMRDEAGIKFQLVLYDLAADYLGVISVKNKVTDVSWSEAALVYWVTGAESGCPVNQSIQNRKYDGSFLIDVNYTQTALADAIRAGEFVLHRVNADIRVLDDINTMVTVSEDRGDIFKDNQTVRVIDQIANDIAVLFATKYLGAMPNDASGRISFWSDIVKHHVALQDIRAIEDFDSDDVAVTMGDTKKSVTVSDAVTVVNTMSKLYMTVKVS